MPSSFRLTIALIILVHVFQRATNAEVIRADLCIYSGNVGGIAAAIEASREGKTSVIIEPMRHLGGMTSGGLSNVDVGNSRTIGGITQEFYREVADYYHLPAATEIEPHVAEAILEKMVANPRIRIQRGETVSTVNKTKNHIDSIVTSNGNQYIASEVIDCSYEGDLLPLAGISSTLRRESNQQYGETNNGVQYQDTMMPVIHWGTPASNGRRPDGRGIWGRGIPFDPYRIANDSTSGLLPLINSDTAEPPGSSAVGLQAYCYRLTMTSDPANRIALSEPPGFEPKQFEAVARFAAACVAAGDDVDLRWFVQSYALPNQKFDFNTACWGADLDGTGQAWCTGNIEQRQSIAAKHRAYQQGLLWFLLNDPHVPKKVRDDLGRFGYCKDEFADNNGWPYQLYVREGRRMISDLVMTEHNLTGDSIAPESIGLGSYGIDIHTMRRLVKDGVIVREGKMARRIPHPYPIGYGAIVPKRSECNNLLVTFAVSASHVAYASMRMEPVLMNSSQSAAAAACVAIAHSSDVQDVPYAELKTKLLANQQVLEWSVPTTR